VSAGYTRDTLRNESIAASPMHAFRDTTSASFNTVGFLIAGLLMAGCADPNNPVLPATGGNGGTSSATRIDGGTSVDGAEMPLDAGSETATSRDAALESRPTGLACDLLKQDCGNPAYACYPVAGAGHCQWVGDTGLQGSCVVSSDPTEPSLCASGLACIPLSAGNDTGFCLRMCDIDDPEFWCGLGNSCWLLPGFSLASGVGYCQSA
jgi:hypothetical protein